MILLPLSILFCCIIVYFWIETKKHFRKLQEKDLKFLKSYEQWRLSIMKREEHRQKKLTEFLEGEEEPDFENEENLESLGYPSSCEMDMEDEDEGLDG